MLVFRVDLCSHRRRVIDEAHIPASTDMTLCTQVWSGPCLAV
jgi:hypothetical protein